MPHTIAVTITNVVRDQKRRNSMWRATPTKMNVMKPRLRPIQNRSQKSTPGRCPGARSVGGVTRPNQSDRPDTAAAASTIAHGRRIKRVAARIAATT
jgi:hypothetical protein